MENNKFGLLQIVCCLSNLICVVSANWFLTSINNDERLLGPFVLSVLLVWKETFWFFSSSLFLLQICGAYWKDFHLFSQLMAGR